MHLHYPEEAQEGVDAPMESCAQCRKYRQAQLHVACRSADFEAVYGPEWKPVARKQFRRNTPLPPPCHEMRVARLRKMLERGFTFEAGELSAVGVGDDELK